MAISTAACARSMGDIIFILPVLLLCAGAVGAHSGHGVKGWHVQHTSRMSRRARSLCVRKPAPRLIFYSIAKQDDTVCDLDNET
jgi:hypothetical protein